MSKIECGQLHSELFSRRHSTLQSHGLFALAKHLFVELLGFCGVTLLQFDLALPRFLRHLSDWLEEDCPPNYLQCVEWDIKPHYTHTCMYTCTHMYTCSTYTNTCTYCAVCSRVLWIGNVRHTSEIDLKTKLAMFGPATVSVSEFCCFSFSSAHLL